MNFKKYHALGNDYLVLSSEESPTLPSKEAIELICHRNFGLGSDGILYADIKKKPFGLRIFNPDGSEAEKSGNGLRIFARYLYDNGHVTKEEAFEVETVSGVVNCTIYDPDERIEIDMGKALFGQEGELEINDNIYPFYSVSMGNPHCVIMVEAANKKLAEAIGPIVENDERFPNRTNVQFLELLNAGCIKIEIWERGAGYTLASGSSACAAAAIAFQLGKTENQVTVQMPGGALFIDIDTDWMVKMTGPTTFVGDFSINSELLSKKSLHQRAHFY